MAKCFLLLAILFCIVLGRRPSSTASKKFSIANVLRDISLADADKQDKLLQDNLDNADERDAPLVRALRSALLNNTLSVYNLGTSIEDAPILALRFCLNSTLLDPYKTSVRFVAGIHGNDAITVEYMLNLIADLVLISENISGPSLRTDDLTDALLNILSSLDVWIVAVLNPDGLDDERLVNEDGVDINRDFPSVFLDDYRNSRPRHVQPETLAYMMLTRQTQFALGLDFFAGAEVVAYPFHGNPMFMSGFNTPTPDDALFRNLAYMYARSNVNMITPKWLHNGSINGAEWFVLYRTPADWSYSYTGTPVLSVYTDKLKALDNVTYAAAWETQVNSLIDLLSYVNGTGVRGSVYPADATKSLPDRVYVQIIHLTEAVSSVRIPARTLDCDVYAAGQAKKSSMLHRTYFPAALGEKPVIQIDNLTSGFSVLLDSGYYLFRTYCDYGFHSCNFYSTCSFVVIPPDQDTPVYLDVPMEYLDSLDVVTFTPTLGPIGTILTINGTDFRTTYNVSINGTAATIQSHILNELVCTVQPGTHTGVIFVRTNIGNYTSESSFTVTTISFAPTFGPVGTHVTFTGMDFRSTTSCAFHGVNATILVANITSLVVIVETSTTTGTVHIVTSSVGSFYTNASFNVTTIAFAPRFGPVGTIVTMTGADFTTTTNVSINGVAATIQTHASNELVCTVYSGTTTGTVSIFTNIGNFNLSAFNVTTITFTPATGAAGTVIIVHNADFSQDTPTVTIGNATAVVNAHVSGTLNCTVGTTDLGPYPLVTVTPNYGTFTTTTNFTVHA